MLDALAQMSFIDSTEKAVIPGEPHTTVHLAQSGLLSDGFDTPSDFVRAYPMSNWWLTLILSRIGAVASVYRLAASLSPGIEGPCSQVEFHRRECHSVPLS